MQSKVVALLVMLFVISLGVQQSYADEYHVSIANGCDGIPDASWSSSDNTCTLNASLEIHDADNDQLIIDPLTKLIVPNGIELITAGGGRITIEGTLENNGYVMNDGGDVDVLGTFDNFSMFENYGGLDVSGTFTNHNFAEFTSEGESSVSGTFHNIGTFQNSAPFNINDGDPSGTVINEGTITNSNFWRVYGLFINNGLFTQSFILTNSPTGTIENYGDFSIDPGTQNNVEGNIKIKSDSTFTNNGLMSVYPSAKIDIESVLDNFGVIDNQCGLISDAVNGSQPTDKCPPEVIINTPIDGKKYGDKLPVELNGTAIDKNNLGVEGDITSSLIWIIKQGSVEDILPDGGSPVFHTFEVGNYVVNATVYDSAGLKDSHEINVLIIPDNDSDGFVNSEDCNPNDPFVYLGAPERINGYDDSCDGTLSPDELDYDEDKYIVGLFVESDWLGAPVPDGGNDCDDNNKSINPGVDEIFGDEIDNNCNVDVDEGFTDDDNDGYVFETENVLIGFSDCLDSPVTDPENPYFGIDPATINPAATEIFDDVDNNCDGVVNEGFDDADSDGYLPGPDDCNDNDPFVYLGAPERINGYDDSCDGTLSPDELDYDEDKYIVGLFVESDWLGAPVPDGGNDCDDTHVTVNPGANEMSVIDGVDTDCNPLIVNLNEIDYDEDKYIVGLFTIDDWLGAPVPDGGNDCDDDNKSINPGAQEVANGIDDDCDGTVDLGLDDDGDGYVTGNIIGVSDCLDSPVTDPENPYFGIDPVTINPGALEIFGDEIDNNCDDIIDEEKAVLPELQNDLTDKQINKFESLIKHWNKEIQKLEDKIISLNNQANKEESKGNLEKAEKLRAEAEDNVHEIEILEDKISVVEMSIGTTTPTEVLTHYQDKLLSKTVKDIKHEIHSNDKKIDILLKLADKLDEQAQKYADKGKQDKANKIHASAESFRDEANVYEDLNEVLTIAINYVPSDDSHHHHND